MFAIDQLHRLRRLPLAILVGLGLMVAGGILDVAIHLAPLDPHAHEPLAEAHGAHLLGIAGMCFVLAGVVIHGARSHRRQAARSGGLDSHAHR